MSRRNRANRFTEKPAFQDGKAAPAALQGIVEEAEDDEKISYFGKIGAFVGGCWEKIAAISKSGIAKTWSWCSPPVQWSWNKVKTISSYCAARWNTGNTENGEDEIDEIDEIESPAPATKVEPIAAKVEPVKTSAKPVDPKKPATAKIEYDEDELAPSGWWNLGIKTAAIAAAALILVGGYFAVKPLFNAPMDDTMMEAEMLEPTEQPSLSAQDETPPDTEAPLLAVPAVAVPEPIAAQPIAEQPVAAQPVAASFVPPVPQQPDVFAAVAPTPPQGGSFLENDPFFAPQPTPVAPAVAEAAPPISSDSAETAMPNTVVEPPAPPVVESEAPPVLAALQPLAPLESVQIASSPPLPPLVSLNLSAPSTAVAAAPAAAPASVYAPVAANRGGQQSQNRSPGGPAFSEAPVPPTVTALPQTVVERTITIAEPTKEIIPQIQHTGTIQNVPPPVVAETPEHLLNEAVPSVARPMDSEPVPAIPRDAPIAASPPVVVVPAATPMAEFASSQIVSADTLPIDWQLWEQVQELRNGAEAEPMQLRFDSAAANTEPALRFTPRDTVSKDAELLANEDNLLVREAANSFGDLVPSPNSNDIPVALRVLEGAPQPVWAELAPAYRSDATSQPAREGGLTFQSRIASEVSRSPSSTETYTIQQGDTYMTISDRFYGTSLLYTALAAHNQQLGIGWRLAEGVVIEIPTAEFLRTQYGEAQNRRERQLESQRSAVRYIVQEGDTIFRLATDRLHDSTRWREIYALNVDRIQDVRDLKPGMEILLPVEAVRRN